MRFALTLFFGLLAGNTFAQIDTLQEFDIPEINQEALEDFLLNTGQEDFDFNTLLAQLEYYRERPLNLNQAGEVELRALQLLSDAQILDLISYRQTAGPLMNLFELQSIPSFDLATIRRILPFVTVNTGLDDFQVSLPQMLARGRNELYLRWFRILNEQVGYTDPENEGQSRYAGDPNQLYLRFKHGYSNRLSFGFTAEKDRGEDFFRGSNPNGFDYYSAHFYLRDYNRWLRSLAIGDYNISFGQGLILYSGFGYGKSAITTNIKRLGRAVIPYTSVNESLFFRGAAATVALGENWEATAFVSRRRRDANLVEPDTILSDQTIQFFSSFQDNGFHRTPAEIADEKAIRQFSVGGQMKYEIRDYGHIAFNVLHDRFDKELTLTPRSYNQFFFQGDRLLNMSFDYSFRYRNFNFFGETARSSNGAIATVNGLLLGLDRKVDLALYMRHLPRDYQANNANPLAETAGARNETGVYMGIEVRPTGNFIINAYYDLWEHPWLRFQVDAPSTGSEYRARITYFKKRRMRVYAEVRNEIKQENAPRNETKLNFLTNRQTFQTRLHISNQLSKALELRTRVDWGFFDNQVEDREYGFAIVQDVLYRPLSFPIAFTGRFAIFDTDSYDIRFYHFENDLLYTFSIPAYYNKGTRFYLNARYKVNRNLTIEGRIAQTYWQNRNEIGSGLETINGRVRTEARAQIRYVFGQ